MGEDQGLLLVAGDCGVLADNGKTTGLSRNEVVAVVWGWQVLRGEPSLGSACLSCQLDGIRGYMLNDIHNE